MHGRPFTEEDIQYIKDQLAKGVKRSAIAEALGRDKDVLKKLIRRISMTPEQRLAWNEHQKEYRKQYRAEHRDAHNEYQKRYYAKHRDAQKEYQKQYRAAHPKTPEQRDAQKEYQKRYYAKHRDAKKEYMKRYRAEHRDARNEYQKQYRAEHLKTPEQRASWNEYMKRYRAAHPERVKAWREAQTLRAAERILRAREAAAAAELEETRRLIKEGGL